MNTFKTKRRVALLLFICLFVQGVVFGQDKTQEIKTDLQGYFDLLMEKKISEALDYVHPKLMGIIGKETFEKQYNDMFSNPQINVYFEGFGVDSISDILENGGSDFALVKYHFRLINDVDTAKDESGQLPAILLNSFKTQFGEENVTLEGAGKVITNATRELFAVKSSEFEGWKIVDYEKGLRMLLVSFIPEEVLKHFNK